jgi:hypothetical protein
MINTLPSSTRESLLGTSGEKKTLMYVRDWREPTSTNMILWELISDALLFPGLISIVRICVALTLMKRFSHRRIQCFYSLRVLSPSKMAAK